MTMLQNNKRIAKNTLFLYMRSFIILGVGLYTSRVVLAQLGVRDFGIYNVVGGVILLFSFIQNAMSSATTRFFTFDLGTGDFEKLKKTFNLSVVIHIFTALVILILGETVGLWFLNNKLDIPIERMFAANVVYQFTVLSACIGILQVPYMCAINAHERMKVFAYAGLIEAAFKLGIAVALGFAPVDKLKFYAALLFLVYVVMMIFYRAYCRKNFSETRFEWFWDKKMFFERIKFSGLTTIAGISAVAILQGTNMLVNLYFGVLANAAMGIMTTVQSAAMQLSNNIALAFNPQVTKTYAKSDFDALHKLMFRYCKFIFLLCFMIALPLVINMDFILHAWLKEVPKYAVVLCQIRIIEWNICMIQHPFVTAIYAGGKIKRFIIVETVLIFGAFFAIWYLFSIEHSIVVVPWAHLFLSAARAGYMILKTRELTGISLRGLFAKVFLPLALAAAVSIIAPLLLRGRFDGLRLFAVSSAAFFAVLLPAAYFFVLDRAEKTFIKTSIAKYVRRKNVIDI